MKKRVLKKVLALTVTASVSMTPAVSVFGGNITESEIQPQVEETVEDEEAEVSIFAEDAEVTDKSVDTDSEIEEVQIDEQDDVDAEQSVEPEVQAEEDFSDSPEAVGSSDSVTINIQDDNGYFWNGYYNDDGTITINGSQTLYGNAKADSSSQTNDALIIPETIGGKKVTVISGNDDGEFSMFDPTVIRKVVFPKTATSVDVDFNPGYGYFAGLLGSFSKLEELDLGGVSAQAPELFGYGEKNSNEVPLKKLTMESSKSISWWRADKPANYARNGITTLILWGDDTGYMGVDIYNYQNLETLEINGNFNEIGFDNCPKLKRVEASKDINQVYFTELKNCPNLDIPKVRVNGRFLNQSCMFENSRVEEITIDLADTPYFQIYKSVFCKAYNLKAINVENAGNTGFCSLDGALYWKKGKKNDLFFYPPAKNPGGVYNVPKDLTCIYTFAFYGSKVNKIVFPEDITDNYYWDYEYLGDWYTTEDFPELTGKDKFYLGDLCTPKVSVIKGTGAADGYYYTDWNEWFADTGFSESQVEFRTGSTHKISYNLNGGTNDPTNPVSYTVGVTAPVELKKPVRNGYTFVKWVDQGGYTIRKTEPYGLSGDLVYTAIWEENKKSGITGNNSAANTVSGQQKLTITGETRKVAAGKKTTLQVKTSSGTVNPLTMNWISSNTKVATVSKKGVVTFKKNTGGKSVVITATLKSNKIVKVTYKLTATKNPVTKITISGKKTMKVNKSQKLKAKVSGKSGAYKAVKWTSSNKKYATVTSKGQVKALKAGKGKTVKITATALDGSGKKATFKIKLK